MTTANNLPQNVTSLPTRTALPSAWIDRLFSRFTAMYGNRFADMWAVADLSEVKTLWAEELASLGNDEIAHGVSACKTRDWPPNLPEFLKLCRPPIDFESAYIEAVEQMRLRETGNDAWSSPAIYWAAVTIGAWDLRNATYGAIKARWARVFGEQMEKGKWPAIPAKAVALPAPGETSLDPEEVARRMAAIKSIMAGKVRA